MMHLKVVSFTQNGAALAERVRDALTEDVVECYARTVDVSLRETALTRFAQQAMVDCAGIVFIGATGIAVRAIAPYVTGKAYDPAVLVLDEAGKFVIPLLSGHLGGANALALRLAQNLGATPVLTTATDVNRVFAVDTWAKEQGLQIARTEGIRFVSGALLRGDTVGLHTALPLVGKLPEGIAQTEDVDTGIVISCRAREDERFAHTLHLIPRTIVAGIGCRRGKTLAELTCVLDAVLQEYEIAPQALCALATIDVKRDEVGLLALSRARQVPLRIFSAAQLRETVGDFTPSSFVADTVGVDNVCERAAVCASGGTLLCRKIARDGITVALAAIPKEVRFP